MRFVAMCQALLHDAFASVKHVVAIAGVGVCWHLMLLRVGALDGLSGVLHGLSVSCPPPPHPAPMQPHWGFTRL